MKKKTGILFSVLISALFALSANAYAGLVNDIPSCYAANHFQFKSAPYQRLIYVLIDQTVMLDPQLQQSVISNINRMLGPGTKFVVAEFSAFSQDRYLNVLHTGIIEYPLTKDESGNVPMSQLPKFKACMNGQARYSIQLVDKSAQQAMQNSSSSLDQSDIMAALKTVSESIKSDAAQKKVLFLVSDALENSAVMSFYHHHVIAKIEPDKAIQKAKKAGMFGDFGGTKIYVLGAGLLPPAKHGTRAMRDGYRDPITLSRLHSFWTKYFDQSNGKLVEFGAPALVEPLSY